jgi:hypothetical protein
LYLNQKVEIYWQLFYHQPWAYWEVYWHGARKAAWYWFLKTCLMSEILQSTTAVGCYANSSRINWLVTWHVNNGASNFYEWRSS